MTDEELRNFVREVAEETKGNIVVADFAVSVARKAVAAERQACATRVAGIRQRVETLDLIEPDPDLSTIDWLRVAESAVRSNAELRGRPLADGPA